MEMRIFRVKLEPSDFFSSPSEKISKNSHGASFCISVGILLLVICCCQF